MYCYSFYRSISIQIPKEKRDMAKKVVSWLSCGLLCALLAVPVSAQGGRGKAELKAGSGSITIDYGRPALKGRDMLSKLSEGMFWRMGMNQAAVFSSPVDLTFGGTKIPKGSYSLWLKKQGDKFLLVFNSQTGQWGTEHDAGKDVYSAALKAESSPSAVESFTIELKPGGKGGEFALSWGTTKLTAELAF
jgi:hypothetical protein